ncbi:MAG: phosphate acetyltransferase [candidate division KSB1 bacterium]|nr:phosphate acetyltransferase [candidate division KSB1 bacterium]
MSLIDKFIRTAKKNPLRIVYPEGKDPRIVEAACKVRDLGVAQPLIIGDVDEVREIARNNDLDLGQIPVILPAAEEEKMNQYADIYAKDRDVKAGIARKLVKKQTSFAGMMVRAGDADGMVAGVATATANVIQYASLTIGFLQGMSTPSSFFIMELPEFQGRQNEIFIFADCAVNISPTSKQLAEIGVASGFNALNLLQMDPKIAFLSFATRGSANHSDVDKVHEAVDIAREMAPQFQIDGELQGDAAIIERVAQKKAGESEVAGHANVLIFPDLDAGNICYKLVQYMAHANAYGPILQGFRHPVNDMSRGATVDDLIAVTAITVVQAQNSR